MIDSLLSWLIQTLLHYQEHRAANTIREMLFEYNLREVPDEDVNDGFMDCSEVVTNYDVIYAPILRLSTKRRDWPEVVEG